ncbi:MAG: PQQ-like beta-propeller repeat protein [Saprospiraceae bacterium]|nr:PQQ-like beta-propeller repeat protein [Saprospiraceae bacterium]MBK7810294.1 PQQ-like beta-propeller repeat protein [Saprospiraceae bacterium]MBK9629897.1 PQQ-like beta-propeller repeat protein [Saprospiraceae bacterium]
MKIFTLMLALIFYVLINFACEPQDMPCVNPPCEPVDTTTPKPMIDTNIVWKHNADTNRNVCSSMVPVLYGNTVLFSRRTSGIPDGFMFFNKGTGELLHLYEDHISPEWKSGATYQYKQFCVVTDWYEVFLLDMESNRMIKRINLRNFGYDGRPRISGLAEWVYIPVEKLGHPKQEYTNTWLRWNMVTDQMEEVLTIVDQGTFAAGFESLAFWFKPNGDTVMIFQNRQYDFINSKRRIDLYAYNMRTLEIEWKVDSFTITGNTSVFPIIIEGDHLYFQGGNEAFCFSCVDGSLIWSQYFPGEGFFVSNAILEEELYLLKGETKKMYALDKKTGSIVWVNNEAGTSSSNLVYHKGYIYYETGQDGLGVLRRIRVSDGKVDWTLFPSTYKQFLHASYGPSGIVIDHETDLLYANDRVYHLCIKLPK